MEKGWNAKGLLAPLWAQLDGSAKRDRLGELAGIGPQTLSAYNSGNRALGLGNARKIVEALEREGVEVSLLELGAPESEADARGRTLVDRLEELAADLAEVARIQALILDELALAVDDKGRLASPPSQTPARRKTRAKGR